MSKSIVVYLKGHVYVSEILNILEQIIKSSPISEIKKEIEEYPSDVLAKGHSLVTGEHQEIINGNIYFTTNSTHRLFYFYSTFISHENLEYAANFGLEDFELAEKTSLTVSYSNENYKIMEILVKYFGGWISKHDLDYLKIKRIDKDYNLKFKPCVRVTMEDVYEKFGQKVYIEED